MIKGTLIPIGGNEDKGIENNENYTLDFISDGILSQVVDEIGGTDKFIIIVPTASSIPKEVAQNYITAFDKLGCTNIKVMDITTKEEANDTKWLDLVRKADGIMFSGGDQSKIVKCMGDTEMHKLLMDKYLNTKFVIAGTSAGAMSMTNEMIAGGSATDALFKGSVILSKGMNYINDFIIDTHYVQRGRFGRLAESMAKFPNKIGIGLAEDTGMIIKQGNHCKVIGSGMVIVYDPSHLTHNKIAQLEDGTPLSMSSLMIHILAIDDEFFIDTRQVRVSSI